MEILKINVNRRLFKNGRPTSFVAIKFVTARSKYSNLSIYVSLIYVFFKYFASFKFDLQIKILNLITERKSNKSTENKTGI